MLKAEAKVGMKVVSLETAGHQLKVGDTGVILRIEDETIQVKLDKNGYVGGWFAKRFAEKRPAVGSRVHCIDPAGTKLKKMVVYVVTAHDADGVNIRIDGARNKMKASRFAIIPPVVVKQGPIEVGDLVVFKMAQFADIQKAARGGAPGWNGGMEDFVWEQRPVIVTEKGRWLKVEGCQWFWREEWFEHAGAEGVPLPVPPPPPPPEVQKDIRAMLRKSIGTEANLCSMAWQFKNTNGKFTEQINVYMPCHAALNRGNHGLETVAVIYGISTEYNRLRKSAMLPIYREYVHYMLNESPWAFAYLTKDVEEAFTKEIVMNVDIHRHHMAGACIALRAGQEFHAQRLPMFDLLVKKGVGKHAAHLLAQDLSVDKGAVRTGYMHGGHMELDRDRNMDDLLKFYKRGYHIPQDGTVYRKNATGYVSAAAIAGRKGDTFGKWIEENLKMTKVNAGNWNESKSASIEDTIALGMLLAKLIEEA